MRANTPAALGFVVVYCSFKVIESLLRVIAEPSLNVASTSKINDSPRIGGALLKDSVSSVSSV